MSKARVMIVDDEVDLLNTLQRHLKFEGIDADIFSDPIIALAHFETVGGYDVLISDIRMPNLTGEELLVKIQDINPLCNVIMMTGFSNMTHVVQCISDGAIDYFSKPMDDTNLFVSAVQEALDRTKRWRSGMGFATKEKEGL